MFTQISPDDHYTGLRPTISSHDAFSLISSYTQPRRTSKHISTEADKQHFGCHSVVPITLSGTAHTDITRHSNPYPKQRVVLCRFFRDRLQNGSPCAIEDGCLFVCLVTLVYCGQTVGWIKMPLGMEVGLGPGDIVL